MLLIKENENLRNHKDLKESFAKSYSAQNPTRKTLELGKNLSGGGGSLVLRSTYQKCYRKI